MARSFPEISLISQSAARQRQLRTLDTSGCAGVSSISSSIRTFFTAFILCAANFTPVPRWGYRVGVPRSGSWREILNSDATMYGGSGVGNCGGMEAEMVPSHGHPCSLPLTLPPLGIVVFHFKMK